MCGLCCIFFNVTVCISDYSLGGGKFGERCNGKNFGERCDILIEILQRFCVKGSGKTAKVLNFDQDSNYKLQNTSVVCCCYAVMTGEIFLFNIFKTWSMVFLSVC